MRVLVLREKGDGGRSLREARPNPRRISQRGSGSPRNARRLCPLEARADALLADAAAGVYGTDCGAWRLLRLSHAQQQEGERRLSPPAAGAAAAATAGAAATAAAEATGSRAARRRRRSALLRRCRIRTATRSPSRPTSPSRAERGWCIPKTFG